jgi:hypothetical protein
MRSRQEPGEMKRLGEAEPPGEAGEALRGDLSSRAALSDKEQSDA